MRGENKGEGRVRRGTGVAGERSPAVSSLTTRTVGGAWITALEGGVLTISNICAGRFSMER